MKVPKLIFELLYNISLSRLIAFPRILNSVHHYLCPFVKWTQ